MAEIVDGGNLSNVLESALDARGKLLRLTPTWVPRSFLHAGKRIRLNPRHYYSYGAARGEIDKQWFASATEAATTGVEIENTGRKPLVGLRYFGPDTFESGPAVGNYRD